MNARKSISILIRLAPLVLALSATGCGKFFTDTSSSSGGGGSTTTGTALYVANSYTSTLAEYTVSSSGVSTLSGSPITLAATPTSLAMTPSNSLLYVGSAVGAIYAMTVGTGGVLTVGLSGSAAAVAAPSAMKVDPSGKWLIAVDDSPAIYVYGIDTSTGALTLEGNLALTGGSPNHIAFNPAGNICYVSLGTGGVQVLTFNSGSGTLSTNNLVLNPKQANDADEGITVDPSGAYLLVAETGISAIRVLSINSTSGALSEVSGSPFTAGTGPSGVMVDYTGAYVYATNLGSNSVSAWSFNATTGALSGLSGSPYSTGSEPVDLAEDSSHGYIGVVCEGGDPDMQIYSIGSGGALKSFKSLSTATDPAVAVAIAAQN